MIQYVCNQDAGPDVVGGFEAWRSTILLLAYCAKTGDALAGIILYKWTGENAWMTLRHWGYPVYECFAP